MTLPRITQHTCTTLDSGANTGWAYWAKYPEGWVLQACGLYVWGRNPKQPHEVIPGSACVVVEVPQAYPSDSLKKTNDLFKTTQKGAMAAGYLRPEVVHFLTAHEWGGGVPKDIKNSRTWDRLTDREKALVPVGGKRDDCLDAIGIGLVVTGRW